MICLTGDVHHDSLGWSDQKFLRARRPDLSEIKVSVEYVRLCEKHGVKCTLYTTGKTLAEQWDAFGPIAGSAVVEVGGHTYGALEATSGPHGRSHGTYDQQRQDVAQMVSIARQRLGKDIVSWRGHGLVRDEHTYKILWEMGIRYISDEVNWDKTHPERLAEGLISHPLNVIMDHDHLYHADRTPESVKRTQARWPSHYGPVSESYPIGDWARIVEDQVRRIEEEEGVATVLMHPICMFLVDEFQTLERLLKLFSQSKTIWAREVGGVVGT